MKTVYLSRVAIPWGLLWAVICLVSSRPVCAQTIPGDYFDLTANVPSVRITSPANHATFFTPVDIPIFAFAREARVGVQANDIEYTNVEFYAANADGTNDLGPGFCLTSSNTPPKAYPPLANYVVEGGATSLGSMYCLVWTNVPAGTHALTAVAQGYSHAILEVTNTPLARTSAPVNITVIASLTNSNPLDVVSVAATDPVAVAGTNACWIWPGVTNGTPAWTNWPPTHWGYTTNWGPKDGLFTVRRFGNVISNLTVNFYIGGTASNGWDYVALTNKVTIPAGEAYALIPVVPLDHGNHLINFSKTVVLSLNPDTNQPPSYVVGQPLSAEVVILNYWPRPLPYLLPDLSFHLNYTNCPDGAWFYVQNSGDLLNWTTVSTNQVINGSIDFVDPNASGNSIRFYRSVPLTNTPAD